MPNDRFSEAVNRIAPATGMMADGNPSRYPSSYKKTPVFGRADSPKRRLPVSFPKRANLIDFTHLKEGNR